MPELCCSSRPLVSPIKGIRAGIKDRNCCIGERESERQEGGDGEVGRLTGGETSRRRLRESRPPAFLCVISDLRFENGLHSSLAGLCACVPVC